MASVAAPQSVELVAPAGTHEILKAALDQGADAVYVGLGPFNLRARAPAFDVAGAEEAAAFVHARGKRLYAALNAMADDRQLADMERMLAELADSEGRPDAVIVSDPGVLSLCRRALPDVALHLSTQTGTFSAASMRFWKEQGVSRIVLPRELTLEQIGELNRQSLCQTELFIHGAMCVSVSGRCLLGAYLSGRHPNWGDCPQPCRLRYRVTPLDGRGALCEGFDLEETERGVYLLNSRDLNTLPVLPAVVASGVSAVKIEGRNKSLHYVSSTVKTYRAALDAAVRDSTTYAVAPEWAREMDRLDHRPYTTGFYTGEYALQEPGFSKVAPSVRVVGVVKAILENGRAALEVKNPFSPNEILNVLPTGRAESYDVVLSEVTGLGGNRLTRTPSNTIVVCASDARLRVGDILRRQLPLDVGVDTGQ